MIYFLYDEKMSLILFLMPRLKRNKSNKCSIGWRVYLFQFKYATENIEFKNMASEVS